ncbi:hypothetical protein C8F04DRAFT_1138792, partial [Mycena alexandri]
MHDFRAVCTLVRICGPLGKAMRYTTFLLTTFLLKLPTTESQTEDPTLFSTSKICTHASVLRSLSSITPVSF